VGYIGLKLSHNIVGLDNDVQNSHFMFVEPLTTMRDNGRGTIIMELHIKDDVNGSWREEGKTHKIREVKTHSYMPCHLANRHGFFCIRTYFIHFI